MHIGQGLHGPNRVSQQRLLRANADARRFEQPQRESACTDAYRDGVVRHQTACDDSHGLTRQKAELRQSSSQFERRRRIRGGDRHHARNRTGGEIRQFDGGGRTSAASAVG